MKRDEAIKIVSERLDSLVRSYHKNGYHISFETGRSLGNETYKVDLINPTGRKITRFAVFEETECGEKIAYKYVIKQFDYYLGEDYEDLYSSHTILWNDDKHFVEDVESYYYEY